MFTGNMQSKLEETQVLGNLLSAPILKKSMEKGYISI
jgi:hypothetical protein